MRPVKISVRLDVSITPLPWSPRRLLVRGAWRLITFGVLGFAAIFFVMPIVWLLLESTRTGPGSQFGLPFAFGSVHQVLLNWQVLFSGFLGQTGTWLANSVLYSGSGVLIAVVLGIPAGYGLAAFEFLGRRSLLIATMIAMLIPSNALVLPLVLEAHALSVLSSPLAVILPYGLFPFGVYIAFLYFNTPRVHGLVASARVDGCSEWQAFRHVALPLAAPVTGLVVVLDFIASWTNYFLPWAMYWAFDLPGRYPVTLGIAQQLMAGPSYGGYLLRDLELRTAAPPSVEALLILVSCAPVIIVLLLAQRWIASGRLQGVFA
jgi:multiple sugar transport system permease protein